MKIALSYAMPGEIESLLAATGAKLLETVHGVPFYEIERDIIAYAGGVGKVNAAMAAQLCIDRCQPDWIVNAGVAGSFHDLPIGKTSHRRIGGRATQNAVGIVRGESHRLVAVNDLYYLKRGGRVSSLSKI